MRVYIRREDRNANYYDTEHCALATAIRRKMKIRKNQELSVGPGYVRIFREKYGSKVMKRFTYDDNLGRIESKLQNPGPGFHLRLKEADTW